jgi:hypothetical protein
MIPIRRSVRPRNPAILDASHQMGVPVVQSKEYYGLCYYASRFRVMQSSLSRVEPSDQRRYCSLCNGGCVVGEGCRSFRSEHSRTHRQGVQGKV